MPQKRLEWIKKNRENIISWKYEKRIQTAYTNAVYNARDLELLHGMYQFEMQMLEYVRQGKPSELQNYLMKYSETGNLNEGKVAGDALRQAKNNFIALVAVIGKTAAIPGGMPIEEAYYLIDTYTQQCELMKAAEEIYIKKPPIRTGLSV